ncbi:MAG: diguanylate cyclase [Rhodoferax sp.]|nr:diguanylate cyclase [Rhodoferax sp.]
MPPKAANHAATRFLVSQLPWLILALMLGVTWFAWDHERQTTRAALRSQFDFALRETVSRIDQRVQGYEQMLRGVQSLFATTPWGNRAAMRSYVDTLQLDANFSGVQTLGVVEWVPAVHKEGHLVAMRQAGIAGYAIEPEGVREAYAPIVQREPYVGRNRAPLGSDIWTDPVRREALERARDSGLAAITGKVVLKVDEQKAAPPGFILYLPVYAQGRPRDSVQQRREALIGWVYAAFHMSDFMASLYGSQSPGLSVAMFDGTDTVDAALLYRSDAADATDAAAPMAAPAGVSATEYMVEAGHNWTLSLRTQDAFQQRYGRSKATEIAVAGMLLSLMLAMLAWQMLHGRARALQLAAAMTEELRTMAQHDPLTGLPNRALFYDRLGQELARAKRLDGRFAMVFIDLDHFKPINDTYGHGVGDQVLRQVAQQLQHSVRASDTVGRIGGDEFVVLLAQLSTTDSILALAEKLRLALKQTFVVEGHALVVSCSVGVAVYPQDGEDAVALTKAADDAMYEAKEAGRDCIRLSDASA